MRNRQRIFLSIILFICCRSNAQTVCVKYDVFGLLWIENKVIRPSVEVAFHKHFSAALSFEKGQFETGYYSTNDLKPFKVCHTSGWGLMPELRYYLWTTYTDAPVGIFIGSFFRFRKQTEYYYGPDVTINQSVPVTDINISTNGTSNHVGIMFGQKFNFYSIFIFEYVLGFGGGRNKWTVPNERYKIPENIAGIRRTEFSLRAEISVGVVFPKPVLKKVDSM